MEIISQRLEGLRLGAPRTFGNLALVPLFDGDPGPPDYLTLDEAIASGHSKVTEVSQGGSVPELLFLNEGGKTVLLLEGEELIGAKQNRVLNLTILAPERHSLSIPVACVEAGRWSRTSEHFTSSGGTMYASGRASRTHQVTSSMRSSGARRADQQAVWADIDQKSGILGTRSATHAMTDMYTTHKAALDEYLKAFAVEPGQAGVAFGIAGELLGMDFFHYPATLQKLFPKLLRGYALDAIGGVNEAKAPMSLDSVGAFLRSVATAGTQVFPGTGRGQDVRLSGERVTGGALVVDGKLLHLSAFVMRGARPRA